MSRLSKLYRALCIVSFAVLLMAFDCRVFAVDRPYEGLTVGWNQRDAIPLSPAASPRLPQADSAQAHDIPTGVSPTTAKLQDWIFWLAGNPPLVAFGDGSGEGNAGHAPGDYGNFSSGSFAAVTTGQVVLEGVHDDDLVVAHANLIVQGSYGGTIGSPSRIRLFAHLGAGPVDPSTDPALDGGQAWLCANADYATVHVQGSLPKAGGTEDVRVYVGIAVPSGTMSVDHFSLSAFQLRAPAIP